MSRLRIGKLVLCLTMAFDHKINSTAGATLGGLAIIKIEVAVTFVQSALPCSALPALPCFSSLVTGCQHPPQAAGARHLGLSPRNCAG